jgi:hypothetical protein
VYDTERQDILNCVQQVLPEFGYILFDNVMMMYYGYRILNLCQFPMVSELRLYCYVVLACDETSDRACLGL